MNEGFFFHHRHRAQRGDLSPIILSVLAEKPMHGYEIIRTFEERSHGFWKPSPGSVYPILQFLEESDLVTSHEKDGKKIYEITDKGREHLKENFDEDKFDGHKHPFGHHLRAGLRFRDMRSVIKDCAAYVKEIALEGTDEQVEEVKALVMQTRDQLKKIVDESTDLKN